MRAVLSVFLLTAVVLAGCAKAPAPEPTGSLAELTASSPLSAYLHDLSPLDPAIKFASAKLEHDRIAASDGVALDTWIAIPPGAGPFPLILTITPYYSGGAPASLGRLGDDFLARGYAVGVSTVRGTGLSGGCFEQGSVQEGKDNAAVVEALAAKPWSNGNVGLIGVSYEGTTPAETWIESPPHLKTIVPIAGITDFYKYNFVNGVPILIQGYGFNAYYWAQEDLLWDSNAPGDPQDTGSILDSITGAPCPEQASVQQGGATSSLDGDKNAYWQSRDFVARLADRVKAGHTPTASVLYVHGLQDWNVKEHMEEGWLPAIAQTGVPFKMLFGQWPHAWPDSTNPKTLCKVLDGKGSACRDDWWNGTLVAWFDQFLKGRDTGILAAPKVQVQDDDGIWRHEASFPPTEDTNATFWLSDGHLGPPGSGSGSFQDAGTSTLVANGAPGTVAQHLVFLSGPLDADLNVAGTPRFVANVTAQGPRASLILTLAEVDENGAFRAVNFAAQSLNHVRSLEAGEPDVHGKTESVDVRFFLQDDVLHKGHRIALIASTNTEADGQPGPSLQPISAGGPIVIRYAGAKLVLPVDPTVVPESPQPFAT